MEKKTVKSHKKKQASFPYYIEFAYCTSIPSYTTYNKPSVRFVVMPTTSQLGPLTEPLELYHPKQFWLGIMQVTPSNKLMHQATQISLK